MLPRWLSPEILRQTVPWLCENLQRGFDTTPLDPIIKLSVDALQQGPVGLVVPRQLLGDVLMTDLLSEYLPILVFLAIAVVLGIAFLIIPLVAAPSFPDAEKNSAYECGFGAFDDARRQFDVRFYLVSILFIIFDLEVAFCFPWAVALGQIGVFGFWSMTLFLGILTIGFIYEWKKGALEWE